MRMRGDEARQIAGDKLADLRGYQRGMKKKIGTGTYRRRKGEDTRLLGDAAEEFQSVDEGQNSMLSPSRNCVRLAGADFYKRKIRLASARDRF